MDLGTTRDAAVIMYWVARFHDISRLSMVKVSSNSRLKQCWSSRRIAWLNPPEEYIGSFAVEEPLLLDHETFDGALCGVCEYVLVVLWWCGDPAI